MLRCLNQESLLRYNDDEFPSQTSEEQHKIETLVERCFDYMRSAIQIEPEIPKLHRKKHKNYLTRGLLQTLPQSYQSLDASRPWLTYWIVHSLAILDDQTTLALNAEKIYKFLELCTNSYGGYGGGPGQISHLATTYAAINTLITLMNVDALKSIPRKELINFLKEMKQKDGSFIMHYDGEIDIRGVYCAVSVAYMTGIQSAELFENTSDWITTCQTYEGGFAGTPGGEAHGGYTFCAIAALSLLGDEKKCDLKALLRWVVHKQQKFEGGFAGRTNKLVDGCYSFWQGAILPIVHSILTKQLRHLMPVNTWLFHQQALQEYILCCCQESAGGFIDKPDRHRDYYHTCYDLSGLSVAQHTLVETVIGVSETNRVIPVHPLYNLTIEAVHFAKQYFLKNPMN